MNPLSFLGPIFSAICAGFNFITGRSNLRNSKEMQAAQSAQKDVNTDNDITHEVRDKNTEALRARISP